MLRLSPRLPRWAPFARRALSTHTAGVLERLGLSTTSPIPGVFNGTWGGAGPLIEARSCATGEVLAQVRTASKEDVAQTLELSRAAYRTWRNVPAPRRGEVLRQIREKMTLATEDLGFLVTIEMGKIKSEGRGEVQEALDVCDWAVGLSRGGLVGSVVPSERSKHFITEVANPLGVVGVVTAFNFPVAVHMWNYALSSVVGNATVWKPAPSTSLCAIATTRIIAGVLEKNGFPGAIASLLCGGGEPGKALVESRDVDLLSFTGSEARGREVAMTVAGRFGKSLLELGGNNVGRRMSCLSCADPFSEGHRRAP